LYVQTHIAENPDEMAWVATLFPWAKDYADVYDHYGLLHERTLLAHGIHLSTAQWQRLVERRARVAVCPTSNTFLGSGLFDFGAANQQGATLALASDVGAGTSLSMLTTAAEAYKVGQLGGHRLTANQLAWAITQGNATALSLATEIGTLEVGKLADLVIHSARAKPLLQHRFEAARDIQEQLFALLMLGDERCVEATWIAGELRYRKA
jgi:guanine deaminase